MKRSILWILLAGLLPAAQVEGNGRGHFGSGKSGWSGRQGAVIGPGVGHRGFRGQGGFGFGIGRRGFSARRSWPLYGWGFGAYNSGYYTTPQEYDAAPDSEGMDSPPDYYYLKPPESNIKPNCQDSPWAGKGSPSSLSSFMNKVFELQCQNRHPAQGDPSHEELPKN